MQTIFGKVYLECTLNFYFDWGLPEKTDVEGFKSYITAHHKGAMGQADQSASQLLTCYVCYETMSIHVTPYAYHCVFIYLRGEKLRHLST